MITVLIFVSIMVALFVGGFIYALKLFLDHTRNLETMLKARDLHEYKHFETKYQETKPEDEPESLVEIFSNKTPEEIRASF